MSGRNDLPLRIELRIPGCEENQISGIDLTMSRGSSWSGLLRHGASYRELLEAREFPIAQINATGPTVTVDHSPLTQLAAELSQVMYLPVTRIAIGESSGNAYDLQFGRAFISMWDTWKTGPMRSQNDAIQKVTDDIATLFGFRRLEIASASGQMDLHIAIDGRSFKLRELGSGLAQFIIVLGNVATKRPTWIFIDEPEISLHPALQLDFLTTLASYGASGAVFATHSLGLARSADRVFSVRRSAGKSVFRPFEATGTLSEFLGEMSFASYRELGYDAVLMVEGINDVKPVQQFLRLLGKDHRVVILDLGGRNKIDPGRADELGEVLRLTEHVHVLIDSEKHAADEPLQQRRRDFLDVCGRLGIRAIATHRRALEHYLTDAAIKRAFGPSYRALDAFQDRGAINPVWAKADNWRAAREMTREELVASDVGEFLSGI